MAYKYLKFTGRINRRSPRNEGNPEDPVMRENLLSRDGRLLSPQGTLQAISTVLSDIPAWASRYYSVETGAISPKTFIYTQDGKLWVLNDLAGTATQIKSGLKEDAYPRSWMIKTQTQTKLYLVDGENFYRYDGNNDNNFVKVTLLDTDGNTIKPLDLIEHKDRLILISDTFYYVSANLSFESFSNSTDCIQGIVGSGKGVNMAVRKIEDRLFIFNTEGKFVLTGDVISAVASTFGLELVEETAPIIAGRTAVNVEGAINYLASDFNIWSFNGATSKKISHQEKLEDFVNKNRVALDKAVASYYDNYYMLSFVETGESNNNLEVFYDAFEDKIDFIRGRNVSCYMQTDPAREEKYLQTGRSDANTVMWTDRGYRFNDTAIVSRLWTRDITPLKGRNVRFLAFYPEIVPKGNRNLDITYLLDGRLTNIGDTTINWTQNQRGESKTLGLIQIRNQSQSIYRVRPKINYAKGSSVAFFINDNTLDLQIEILGIGIEFTDKGMKKDRRIGA